MSGFIRAEVYGFRPYGAVRRNGKHLEARFYLFDSKLEQHHAWVVLRPGWGKYPL